MTVHDTARLLPSIPALRDHCRALALLEAILSPDPVYRHYTFDTRWSATEELASMSTGSGDEFSLVFSPAGAYLRGFDHESPMSPYVEDGVWPGVVDDVPEVFRRYVDEPAFSHGVGFPDVTACLWRTAGDDAWRAGAIEFPAHEDPDGSGFLFEHLTDRSPEAYRDFAADMHEVAVDLDAVRHVLALRPLTDGLVAALNPGLALSDLAADLSAIGWSSPAR
ncbi:hypothetical protein [Streptomyces ficellus]|uniref:Uncharacterized protein n=1 Tax=Streptomyces ficellus TaxID=1977088 RepID=A0A6I6FD66_9ACTN|nr:hypothetical protein [Streptomyces ficellus]QGV81640.1 hypothetical protein EIZ62_27865 [Streptomyces ficellus]